MALVEGTNCGFVTVAPTADPAGTSTVVLDTRIHAGKFTSPAGATTITEIGWWCDNATEEANFEVGVYDHNAGDNNPENLLYSDTVNAKGTNAGWKVKSGLSWAISENTIYWIASQLDDTATVTNGDKTDNAGAKRDARTLQTALINPFGVSSLTDASFLSIYAVYTTGGVTAIPQPAQLTTQGGYWGF